MMNPCKLELFVSNKYTNNIFISFFLCTLSVSANLQTNSRVEHYLRTKEYLEEISSKW